MITRIFLVFCLSYIALGQSIIRTWTSDLSVNVTNPCTLIVSETLTYDQLSALTGTITRYIPQADTNFPTGAYVTDLAANTSNDSVIVTQVNINYDSSNNLLLIINYSNEFVITGPVSFTLSYKVQGVLQSTFVYYSNWLTII
jgi:hypothetical protein